MSYLCLLTLLNLPLSRRYLTEAVADVVAHQLHTRVAISDLQVGLFNRLIISGLRIDDQQHQPLLQAERLSVKIELRSLFKDRLALRTVSVLDGNVNLYKPQADAPTNFQFIIDRLQSTDSTTKRPLNLRINSIILRRVNLRYDERHQPLSTKFNPAHLALTDINANLSLKYITPDSIQLRLRSLSFREKSGVQLKQLSFRLQANRREATIDQFTLTLPHSNIQQKQFHATYDGQLKGKALLSSLRMHGDIHNATIALADLRPFLPPSPLDQLNETIVLNALFDITQGKVSLPHLHLTNTTHTMGIKAHAVMHHKGYHIERLGAHIDEAFLTPHFYQLVANAWQLHPHYDLSSHLPSHSPISATGTLQYEAPHQANLNCQFTSPAGDLTLAAQWKHDHIQAKVNTKGVQLATLLGDAFPTNINLSAQTQLTLQGKQIQQAEAEVQLQSLTYRDHTFTDVTLRGDYTPTLAHVSLQSRDDAFAGEATAEAALQGMRPTSLHANLNVAHAKPAALGISHAPLASATYSGRLTTHLTALTPTAPRGSIDLSDLRLTSGPYGDFTLDNLSINLTPSPLGTHLQLASDFAVGHYEGSFQWADCVNQAKSIVARSLPGLIRYPQGQPVQQHPWQLQLSVHPTPIIRVLTGAPIDIVSPMHLQGAMGGHHATRNFLTFYTDSLHLYDQSFGRTSLFVEGADSTYHGLVQTQKFIKGQPFHIVANLQAQQGSLTTTLDWRAATAQNYNGTLACRTKFLPSNQGHTNFEMHIRPTTFALADSLWTVSSGIIKRTDRDLAISDLCLRHADRSLSIDGHLAAGQQDSIVATLHKIDVKYILDLVDFDAVEFDGDATGVATITGVASNPTLHATLDVPNFQFNKGPMGHSRINGSWSKQTNRINLDAHMDLAAHDGQPRAITDIEGYVDLKQKGLRLDVAADHTNLRFLRRYMDGIFSSFDGHATGNVSIYGPFKAIDFEGTARATATARLDATGVKYQVNNGQVALSAGSIRFNDFRLDDQLGGTGTATGELRHRHLKHLTYDFHVTADHLRCYDQQASTDLPFTSLATGSGQIDIAGEPGHLRGNIYFVPAAPTTLTYTLDGPTTPSTDQQMVRFHAQAPEAEPSLWPPSTATPPTPPAAPTESSTEIALNFLIDTNPAADIKIVTDSRAGDAIHVYGHGPIRAIFNNERNFEMYGTYSIDRGTYNLSIQNVIRKDLQFKPGSSITFAGDPLKADLQLQAAYTVGGVSLSDLGYGAGFSQRTAKVDCLLNIGGTAGDPQINFDLDLHHVSEDEKAMVRRLIATQDDLNSQAIYLLGIGKFYTANSLSAPTDQLAGSGQQQGATAMKSFLSSTLTGQLNAAIAAALGNPTNWSFGTSVNTGNYGWDDLEVEGLFQGRLFNERLLINGNFGYRDKPIYTSNFVGDFDIRYLLTPSGNVSLKAYSETSERYFTKSALTTQGIGLSLQRDFNSLKDLFRIKRNKKKKLQPIVPNMQGK